MPQTVLSQVVCNFLQICILCPCPQCNLSLFPPAMPSPRATSPWHCCCHVPLCVVPTVLLAAANPMAQLCLPPPALTQQAAFRKLAETYLQDFQHTVKTCFKSASISKSVQSIKSPTA